MLLRELQENIKNITDKNRWSRGIKYQRDENAWIEELRRFDQLIMISGGVSSSSSNKEYSSNLTIDMSDLAVHATKCNCRDYKDNHKYSEYAYMCKHLVATFAEFASYEDAEESLRNIYEEIQGDINEEDIDIVDSLFLQLDKPIEKINIEVYINIINDNSYNTVQFKIGKNKKYVIKNLVSFIESKLRKTPLKFGKDFTYDPNIHNFSEEDEEIIRFIEEYYMFNENLSMLPKHLRYFSIIKGKELFVIDKALKRFLLCCKNKNIYVTWEHTYTEVEEFKSKVIQGDFPLALNLESNKDEMILKMDKENELPISITPEGDVFLYNHNFYLPTVSQYQNFKYFYNRLISEDEIVFDKSRFEDVITKVLPRLEIISSKVSIDEEIESKIKKELITKFYLDRKKDNIYLNIDFVYYDDDNKEEYYVIKDLKRENEIIKLVESMGFISQDDRYLFDGNLDDLFAFLSSDIKKLKELGEVYYSDKFKYKINTPNIVSSISSDSENKYLEINFNIGEIKPSEYKNILKSFKQNKKFHKLKNDVLIDLNSDKINNFFKLLDNLDIDLDDNKKDASIKINKNKAVYLDDVMAQESLEFIEGKEIIKSISDKIKTSKSIDYKLPSNLNATLRPYQIEGYKWLKTLDHYEFGGILADEMGLGKTLQTITFLLSKEGKKAIVVAPTSLIYNWKDEFEKFAPSMSVLVMHGNKEERLKLFKDIDKYDVVLTTYSTLKNDFDNYKDIVFDYLVIDEAQNIKNNLAQNTQIVKSIDAKVRFALSGTPMENNLLELWSIFDFIMPGYLLGKTKFTERFIKSKEPDLEDLKRLINPFILRRLKQDVLTELPDKIEKNFFVEMADEQKRVYKSLVMDINNKMESSEFKDDKITVFSYLTKLRQLCLDPSVLIEGYKGKSAKIDVVSEIITQSIKDNHKILLFSQFTSVLKNLEMYLEKIGIKSIYLDGSISATKRIKLVNTFNESEEALVFLISLKAGGTGLNLTSADIVIHFDPWWNPAIENQASDRAHRYGQKNVVEVIKLIAKGTIEEKILKLQEDKKELINKVINGDMQNSNVLSSLSTDELRDLFRY